MDFTNTCGKCNSVVMVALCALLIQNTLQHGGHNEQQGHRMDSRHVQDREHMQEHLKEQQHVGQDMSQMSNEDVQFHYFKVHDSDNDDKLDGIELATAMAHYHDEEAGEKPEDYTEEELGSMVDQILEEDDLNKDGYIDYPEFVASQQREEVAS